MKRGSFVRFSLSAIGAIALHGSMQTVQASVISGNELEPQPDFLSQVPTIETPPTESKPTEFTAPRSPQSPQVLPQQPPLKPTFLNPLGSPAGNGTTPPSLPNAAISPTFLADEDYQLGAGDVVQLQFFNVPEYDGEYQISTDGRVNLPLIGRVSLKGLTVEGAGDRLASAYAKELRYPQIDVLLIRRRPLQIVMRGEISQPGLYVFPSDTNGEPPRLFQAIQTAGGITQAGDLEQVQIMRGSTGNSQGKLVAANLLALLQYGDLTQNIDLRDGDIITVPPASVLNVENLQNLAISNLKSQSTVAVDVTVVGEVDIPGPYRFEPTEQATLISAIQQAGGLSPFADVRQLSLERRARDGSKRSINIDLFAILETGDRSQDVLLQNGDVIKIPTAALSNEQIATIANSTLTAGPIPIAILGEVKAPGPKEIPPNTTLSQAILAAGGFSNIARHEVKLLRFNPNGTVTEQQLKVDLQQTANAENNPILKPNDIIMVGKSTWGSIKEILGSLSSNFNFFLPFLFFR